MDFKTFRTEFAKAHKGEPSKAQSEYDAAKKAKPDDGFIRWQAAAWNAFNK